MDEVSEHRLTNEPYMRCSQDNMKVAGFKGGKNDDGSS